MNKLRDNRGETLIESLVSILIAVLAFGIVVTAEKINAKTRNTDVMFRYDGATKQDQDKEIELKGAVESGSGTVSLYENNGYYYYSHDKTGAGL